MLNVLRLYVLPILGIVFLFAALRIYKVGFEVATYGGRDPWSVLFFAVGAASVPIVIATLFSGLIKLFQRSLDFWLSWIVLNISISGFFLWTTFIYG